ncbi:non-ribosomal peptide synthetase [Paenibacillus tengchongensis]|uniref:non-ribosomal peptide synthetase n=1 Tax=Paenibacillus tengchongensis TaxID=2608684 RepID=UPI00165209DF|nr:non-ribosomal peptide synthetase [Paenibacillus tengchongensis]
MNHSKTLEKLQWELPIDISERLIKTSKNTDLSLFVLLVASLKLMLVTDYKNQDFAMWVPLLDEFDMPEDHNSLVYIKTEIPDLNITFKEYLLAVRQSVLDAYESHCSGILTQRPAVQDSNNSSIFCSLENIHTAEQQPLQQYYDFTCKFKRIQNRIMFTLSYNSINFEKSTLEGWLGNYVELLSIIVANPLIAIKDIHFLSERDTHFINKFNDTDYIDNSQNSEVIYKAFERQVNETPESVALIFGNEHLTYAELNQKANRLGRYIQRNHRVDKEMPIGIFVKESLDMIVAMIAIMKTGGAYVPISVSYPTQRIDAILEDCNIKLVITNSAALMVNPTISPVRDTTDIICLDKEDTHIQAESKDNLETNSLPTDLAYILYTSGTTGVPKGVLIEHKNVMNLISGLSKCVYQKFNEQLNVALIASYVFDASVQQIYSALLMGHTLIIAAEDIRRDGSKLIDFYIRNRVHISDGTPVHLRLMNLAGIQGNADQLYLKQLLIGGEVLIQNIVEEFLDQFDGNKPLITNIYGVSECCVDSTFYNYDSSTANLSIIPIGKPLPNTCVYILDDQLEHSPVGSIGGVYISGKSVGRGYMNRPELTQERFISIPHISGDILFKTGDRGRINYKGELEYHGRSDRQVKIRGFRIECGEIQAVLSRYEGIVDCLVIDDEDSTGDKYLCAYYISDKTITYSTLKDYLSEYLPDYMIPSYFMRIDSIPINQSCKIDRAQLPHPASQMELNESPSGDRIENELIEIWKELLEIKNFGTATSFFDLGGQSLKAVLLLAKINKVFSVEVSLMDIFSNTTIKEQAHLIRHQNNVEIPDVQSVPQADYYEVSSVQQRIYALCESDAVGMTYNMPMALRIKGAIDKEKVETVFHSLIARHEILRTQFSLQNGKIVQIVKENVDFRVAFKTCSEESVNREINQLICPFDLKQAPLIRANLIEVAHDEHYLVVDMHHIIADGVSVGILIQEFQELYIGNHLPKTELQYKDYSSWYNKLVKSPAIDKQREYWINVLSSPLPVLNIPTDYEWPSVKTYDGAQTSCYLEGDLLERLNHLAKTTGATLYMVLLAAYQIILSLYSQQEDIIVGSPTSGRNHPGLESMIGMFVNTVAVRGYPSKTKSFRKYLEEIKVSVIKALENQDYQLDDLLQNLKLPKQPGRNSLFEAFFELQNADIPALELEELSFIPYELETCNTKFSLMLSAVEDNNRLRLNLMYSTKLFMQKTIEDFLEDYVKVLEAIANNKYIKIEAIIQGIHNQQDKNIFDENSFTL